MDEVLKGKVIRIKFITRDYVKTHKNQLFVFGDNMVRKGFKGQAYAMRGEPNTIGIPTKWFPSTRDSAYFNDSSWDNGKVKSAIIEAFYAIEEALLNGIDVVIPSDGIGTGDGRLAECAPIIATFVNDKIEYLAQMYKP